MIKHFLSFSAIAVQGALTASMMEKETYAAFQASVERWGDIEWSPYTVTASDGAITTLFRLTGNLKPEKKENRKSILLMHGTFMNATSWFWADMSGSPWVQGVDKPLPVRLWDEGFDVWLGNMRGTMYSRDHTTLDSSDTTSDYWNFSMAEKGMLDVPAAVMKIKDVTNVDKVAYAGYS